MEGVLVTVQLKTLTARVLQWIVSLLKGTRLVVTIEDVPSLPQLETMPEDSLRAHLLDLARRPGPDPQAAKTSPPEAAQAPPVASVAVEAPVTVDMLLDEARLAGALPVPEAPGEVNGAHALFMDDDEQVVLYAKPWPYVGVPSCDRTNSSQWLIDGQTFNPARRNTETGDWIFRRVH